MPNIENFDQGKTEKISDPERITGLLRRFFEHRALLSINIPGSPDLYNSAILEIQHQENYLIIDELNPKSGHQLLLNAGKLGAQTQFKGIQIRFDSTITSSGETDGTAYYRIVLPQTLNYRQQRAQSRAKVSMARPIEILIEHTSGNQLTGYINDISVGGVGIRFIGNFPISIARGECIPKCYIHLPTGDEIHCKLDVRFTSVGVEGNYRMLGARFIQLSSTQEAAIARYVAALDQEFIKKISKE